MKFSLRFDGGEGGGEFLGGHDVAEDFLIAGDEGDLGFAVDDVLGFQNLEHGLKNFRILRDFLQCDADDLRAHGCGFGEFDCCLTLGGAAWALSDFFPRRITGKLW
jgi:hypothetical protein